MLHWQNKRHLKSKIEELLAKDENLQILKHLQKILTVEKLVILIVLMASMVIILTLGCNSHSHAHNLEEASFKQTDKQLTHCKFYFLRFFCHFRIIVH